MVIRYCWCSSCAMFAVLRDFNGESCQYVDCLFDSYRIAGVCPVRHVHFDTVERRHFFFGPAKQYITPH